MHRQIPHQPHHHASSFHPIPQQPQIVTHHHVPNQQPLQLYSLAHMTSTNLQQAPPQQQTNNNTAMDPNFFSPNATTAIQQAPQQPQPSTSSVHNTFEEDEDISKEVNFEQQQQQQDAQNASLVFQCKNCRTLVGDSMAYESSNEELKIICLSCMFYNI